MDSNESRARALLGDLSAGCSAVAWETADGGHLWGRNFDFNRIAADSKVTFVPRGQVFYVLRYRAGGQSGAVHPLYGGLRCGGHRLPGAAFHPGPV